VNVLPRFCFNRCDNFSRCTSYSLINCIIVFLIALQEKSRKGWQSRKHGLQYKNSEEKSESLNESKSMDFQIICTHGSTQARNAKAVKSRSQRNPKEKSSQQLPRSLSSYRGRECSVRAYLHYVKHQDSGADRALQSSRSKQLARSLAGTGREKIKQAR
jgi:hypothetical protein